MTRAAPWFYCTVADTAAARALVDAQIRHGQIAVDHMLRREGRILMALREVDMLSLRRLGLEVTVGDDVGLAAERARVERLPPRARAASETDGFEQGFVTSYLDTDGVYARFAALHAEFPSITAWEALPESTAGYVGATASLAGPNTVRMFRVSTSLGGVARPAMLLVAGAHAREWVPPLAAIELVEQLLRNHASTSTDPAAVAARAIVDALDVIVVPIANPDGVDYSHHDDANWRKNLRAHATSPCRGVDVNRNYPVYWGTHTDAGHPCSEVYAGAAARSEPEARNVLAVLDRFPNILTAVDCHSFGQSLFRAHSTDGEPVDAADEAVFADLETAMNAAIATVSPGTSYSTGTTNNRSGTLDDYLYVARRIYGFTMECATSFQPTIATAAHVALEVAAALRALASRTVTLAASSSTAPVSLAQVLDRSGSMVGSHYDGPLRENARRVVDLLALGDRATVVSFASTAVVEKALMMLDDAGDASLLHTAIDGIHFGGATSIGAGIAAAASELTGAPGRRAAILLSDGYQNTDPTPATALAAWPAGVPIYAIALGPESDIAALQQIATSTGGAFFHSPDEVALHEIYNAARALATEQELSLNEVAASPSAGERIDRLAVVEGAVTVARFAVTWWGGAGSASLRPPVGSEYDSERVRVSQGPGWSVFQVRNPSPGAWRLRVTPDARNVRLTAAMSCALSSPLRATITLSRGRPLVALRDHGLPLRPGLVRSTTRPASPRVADIVRALPGAVRLPNISAVAHGEAIPEAVARLAALRALPGGFVLDARTARALAPTTRAAVRNVVVRVEGFSRAGVPFVRVGLRTLVD